VPTCAVCSRNAAPHGRPASLCDPVHRICPGSFPASDKKKEVKQCDSNQQTKKKQRKTKDKAEKNKGQKKEDKKKKDRGTIRSAVFAPYCFVLAACFFFFPPLSLFFFSPSLSALVISSVCDGLSTLI
jgi:hypothetical protein